MLTQAELKSQLHYNPETGVFTWIKPKSGVTVNAIAGTKNITGYLQITLNRKIYQAHRLAWLYVHGSFPIKFIDHINGVRDDNKISNLREATNKQNCQNKIKSQGKNEYLGAHYHKKLNKYTASIKIDYKLKHLGIFDTAKEAHEAYLKAKREFHDFCTI